MKIDEVWFDEQYLFVALGSGHVVGNPLAWFSRLQSATADQRNNYEIGACGDSLHREDLNEDISLESLFDFKRELNYARI